MENTARPKPAPQELYRHFKGRLYQIVTMAVHSETGEDLVVYQALYGSFRVYARPLSMFMSKVDKTKYPNVAQEWRFEKVQKKTMEALKEAKEEAPVTEEKPEEKPAAFAQAAASPEKTGDDSLPPLLLEFLDSRRASDRLKFLSQMHRRLTDEMVDTMAVALDIEVKSGDLEERYNELKYCLQMRDKYERSAR